MFLHYYTLKRQADLLFSHLDNALIVSSYTQRKNQHILEAKMGNGKVWQLKLFAHPKYPSFFLSHLEKRLKNSVNIITSLVGLRIKNISTMENDRIVIISFHNSELQYVLQFFRNNTNFYLCNKEKKIVNAFKNRKRYVNRIFKPPALELQDPLKIEADNFIKVLYSANELPLGLLLTKKFFHLNKIILDEIAERSQLNLSKTVKEYTDKQLNDLLQTTQTFLNECLKNKPVLYLDENIPQYLMLTEFNTLTHLKISKCSDLNDALKFYVNQKINHESFIRRKKKLIFAIEKKIVSIKKTLRKIKQISDAGERADYFRKIGDLLLSQIQNLQVRNTVIEIIDFYDPDQRKIKIQVNPKLSVQENAANFYRKAKESKEQEENRKQNINSLHSRLSELNDILGRVDKCKLLSKLNILEKRLTRMKILQAQSKNAVLVSKPYKEFQFENWKIWVGKNAKANDELTFRFAHKEDFWMHAQGVSGSHVIVRNPNKQFEKLPSGVENYSAKLAANHSKAKHSSYVPVIVTKVKYVRKTKGLQHGSVIAERTNTIFIEP